MNLKDTQDNPTPAPERSYSTDELKRFDDETRALLSVAAHTLASHAAERARTLGAHTASNEALLDDIRQSMHAAATELTTGAGAEHAQQRTCALLRLHRVCGHARCRRAQACRNPLACPARAAVPEAVQDHVAALLLAERLPFVPAGANAQNRLAYECWIAGLEAGAR